MPACLFHGTAGYRDAAQDHPAEHRAAGARREQDPGQAGRQEDQREPRAHCVESTKAERGQLARGRPAGNVLGADLAPRLTVSLTPPILP